MSPQSESLVNCSHHPHLEHLQYTNTSLASFVLQTKQLKMFSHGKKEIKQISHCLHLIPESQGCTISKYVFYRFQLVNQQRTEEENVIKILSFNLQHTNLLRHEQAFFKYTNMYIAITNACLGTLIVILRNMSCCIDTGQNIYSFNSHLLFKP